MDSVDWWNCLNKWMFCHMSSKIFNFVNSLGRNHMEKDLTSPSIRRNSKNRYGFGTAFIIDTLRKVLEMFPTKREQCLEMMFILLFLAGDVFKFQWFVVLSMVQILLNWSSRQHWNVVATKKLYDILLYAAWLKRIHQKWPITHNHIIIKSLCSTMNPYKTQHRKIESPK